MLERIEKYRILEEVGQGGMSVVYRGRDDALERDVAVKVMHRHLARDPDARKRFSREAKAVASLTHPNIREIYDFSASDDELNYLVTEFVHGEPLSALLREGCDVMPEIGVMISIHTARALQHAHNHGIIHRDVKPENILFVSSESSDMKLIDFGYAGLWAADKQLTGLCGTPDYVAPEVLTWYDDDDNGTPYGKGSDLWSLGVLLYVILSGCSPFSADEEEALLAQVSEAKYEFYDSEWKAISAPAKDLISKLLVVDPATRLTMEACLAHPWLAGAIEKGRQKAAEMASAGPSNGPTSAAAKSEVAVEGSPTAEPMSCSNCVLL